MKKTAQLLAVLTGAFFLLSIAALAVADDNSVAIARVQKAINLAKTGGVEKALDVLNDTSSELGSGSNYVYVYDMDGTMLANAVKKELIGKNVIDVPDAKGKKFRREMVEKMKADGKGWINYVTINPVSKENEEKNAYCEKLEDIFFCCGIYKK